MSDILRVFPRQTSMTPTDAMAFFGDPPLERPEADEVLVSCVFTWDRTEAERLALAWGQYYPMVRLGGPVFGQASGNFTPGMFLKEGITITSRGCPHECPWCFVPKREGHGVRELPIEPGYIIEDDNLLRTSWPHLLKVFDMCRFQRQRISFRGLEANAITDQIAEELRSLRIADIWLAADHDGALPGLRRAVQRLSWLPRDKLRCYVLIGFNGETLQQAQDRLLAVWETGCLPFAQLYRNEDNSIRWSWEWRNIARLWMRPAGTKAVAAELSAARLAETPAALT